RTRSTGSTPPRRSAATRSRATAGRVGGTASSRTSGSKTADGPLMAGRAGPEADGVGERAAARASARVDVRKTYKLFVGGEFPRSESGRSYVVNGSDGRPLGNAVRASRKDLRDAVRAARAATEPWAARTAMNRGQILYRVAELMEGRRIQFVEEVGAAEGIRPGRAADAVSRAIDRWVWYAGWAAKITQVPGSVNP